MALNHKNRTPKHNMAGQNRTKKEKQEMRGMELLPSTL